MTLLIVGAALLLATLPYWLPYALGAVLRRLSVRRLLGGGLQESQAALRVRVVTAFLGGLGDGLRGFADSAVPPRFELPFERPFLVEGMSVGLALARHLKPWTARQAAETFAREHNRYQFLLAIGAGFARGLETPWRGTPQAYAAGPEPRLDALFHDGYGFQCVLRRYPRLTAVHAVGQKLPVEWQAGFYQGVGRALWFFVPNIQALQRAVVAFPHDCQQHALAGYGVAAGFAGIEELDPACWEAPGESGTRVLLRTGLVVGLFARYYVDPSYASATLLGQSAEGLLAFVQQSSALYEELWSAGRGYAEFRAELQRWVEDGHHAKSWRTEQFECVQA